MHTAAKDGNKFTMKVLYDLGTDINIKDKDGVSKIIINGGLIWVLFAKDRPFMHSLFAV